MMTETPLETTDARPHAQSNHCGLALDSHQSVLTTAQLFAEMVESKEEKNAMTEILSMVMDAASDVKESKLQVMEDLHQAQLKLPRD